jgi:hypothetical protein
MIVGHRVDSVECRRDKAHEVIESYRTNYDINIKDRKIGLVKRGGEENKVLQIGYVFTISFLEGIGDIIVKGEIDYLDNLKKLKEINKNWDENREVQTRILNFIFANTIPMVMDISKHVGLPPPIALPRVRPEDFVRK